MHPSLNQRCTTHPGSTSTAVGDVSVCLLPSALLLHRGNYSSRCSGLVSKCTVALEVTGQRRPASWLTWYAEVHEVAVPCTLVGLIAGVAAFPALFL